MSRAQLLVKSFLKKSFGFFFEYNLTLKASLREGITIFTFHEISDSPSEFNQEFGLSVSLDQFKMQVKWINDNFNIINPKLLLSENPKFPENAALLTFDDGFKGAFDNGFPILRDLNIPVIMFLNMKPILTKKPMISALVSYLAKYEDRFNDFLSDNDLDPPYFLNINPKLLNIFLKENELIDMEEINIYQGELATIDDLEKWEKEKTVFFANHFYDHWNALVLTPDELRFHYNENKNELKKYRSHLDFVAFTNGKPNTCFNSESIKILKDQGVEKLFSSVNGINRRSNNKIMGRISINNNDISGHHLWFRLGQANRFLVDLK